MVPVDRCSMLDEIADAFLGPTPLEAKREGTGTDHSSSDWDAMR